ncbi:uncharacterized protein [Diadema antillarum]|uniref:uncharacterized protein n=1 Tax=Diadema antillarum TaxID=105358 RepID=UPI003A84CD85
MSRSKNMCSALNCTNTYTKLSAGSSLYRFPKDPGRCARWVQNTRRKDLLGKSPLYLYSNCRLCSKHFEDGQILCTGRLVWNAVPTKFDVPNPPKPITPKRKLPARCKGDEPKAKRCRGTSVTTSFPEVQADHDHSYRVSTEPAITEQEVCNNSVSHASGKPTPSSTLAPPPPPPTPPPPTPPPPTPPPPLPNFLPLAGPSHLSQASLKVRNPRLLTNHKIKTMIGLDLASPARYVDRHDQDVAKAEI